MPIEPFDAMRELDLHTYKEVWNDIRTYSSNIWQVVGLSLVAIAFFLNMLSAILQPPDQDSSTKLLGMCIVLLFLTSVLMAFRYALYELSERTKERILVLQNLEDIYRAQYLRSVTPQSRNTKYESKPPNWFVTRRLSWVIHDDLVDLYSFLVLGSSLGTGLFLWVLVIIQGAYPLILLLGFVALMLIIILFVKMLDQYQNRLDSSQIKASPRD